MSGPMPSGLSSACACIWLLAEKLAMVLNGCMLWDPHLTLSCLM